MANKSEGTVIGTLLERDGYYRPEHISFVLRKGVTSYEGQIVYCQFKGKKVYYQVYDVPTFRPTGIHEYELAKEGLLVPDSRKVHHEAKASQVGFLVGEELYPYIESIQPVANVYEAPPEEAEYVINPPPNVLSITIGKRYPQLDFDVKLDLRLLLRAGAIIIGTVGSGKTSTMLNIISELMRLKDEGRISPKLLLIDKDAEIRAKELEERNEFISVDPSEYSIKKRKRMTLREIYEKLITMLGLAKTSRQARELRSAIARLEEKGIKSIDWSRESLLNIFSEVSNPVSRDSFIESIPNLVPDEGPEADFMKLINEEMVVHLDFTAPKWTWDEVVETSANILSHIYLRAKEDPDFAIAVFIDEGQSLAPESEYSAPASPSAYSKALPIIKLIATTGARSGVPLFMTTQRLSEVDKTVSTSLSRTIIVHAVEDIDVARVSEFLGRIAYRAPYFKRGHAIIKSHALRVPGPLPIVTKHTWEPRSVGKDCLSKWSKIH